MRTQRECWEYNQGLEFLEKVRRCTHCGAREDKHNLPADMAYYGYEAHPFEYPSEDLISQWMMENATTKHSIKTTE